MIIILLHWNLPGEKPEIDKREEAFYETPTEAAANYEIPVASAMVSIIVYLMLTIYGLSPFVLIVFKQYQVGTLHTY